MQLPEPPSQPLPWVSSFASFVADAGPVGPEGACCVFLVDASIEPRARGGFAAMVIAHSRADEPVTILDDGSAALLVKTGGISAATTAARRVLERLATLSLETTLRVGVTGLEGGPAAAVRRAHAAAATASAGEVVAAG